MKHTPIKTVATYCLTIFTMLSACSLQSRQDSKLPNIILIMADDLGPGLLSRNGQKIIETPHIDRLASEGIALNNYYGGVFCAPARWALSTGLHDGRIGGWQHEGAAGLAIRKDAGEITEEEYQRKLAVHKASAYPVSDRDVFLGQVAQQAGYTTAQFGKLDRGFLTWHERVKRFGWDYYEGMYDHVRCHGFYPPYIYRNRIKIELEGNSRPDCGKTTILGDEPIGYGGETYSQNVFIEGILRFIREHKDEPFFLYHPTQLPHGPVAIPELHPDYAEDERLTMAEKKYASMVRMLDDHVGLIMAELKAQGLDKNTIVFFSSDNGHEMYYGSTMSFKRQRLPNGEKANLTDKKWRTSECGDVFDGAGGRAGMKRSGYQGGIQCVMFARWPGKIQPGIETDLLTSHYDFMATLADIGEVEIPSGKDSLSYLPTLLGNPQQEKHDYIYVHNTNHVMGGSSVITKEGWKLIEDNRTGSFQLYNILKDNEERFELSAKHPERVERLKKILLEQKDSERPDL